MVYCIFFPKVRKIKLREGVRRNEVASCTGFYLSNRRWFKLAGLCFRLEFGPYLFRFFDHSRKSGLCIGWAIGSLLGGDA